MRSNTAIKRVAYDRTPDKATPEHDSPYTGKSHLAIVSCTSPTIECRLVYIITAAAVLDPPYSIVSSSADSDENWRLFH